MTILTKPIITVNVNPTYKCNCNCDYCYLGKLRELSNIIPLNILENKLDTLSKYFTINHIDYYGGEVSILRDDYLQSSYDIMRKYCTDISTITNGLFLSDIIVNNTDHLTFSFNSKLSSQMLKYNIDKCKNKEIHLLSLFFGDGSDLTPKEFLNKINELNISSVRIIEYCKSQTNDKIILPKNYNELYEDFIYNCIIEYINGNYNFILSNFLTIQSILNDSYTILPKSCFITPDGNYGVLTHIKGEEYFKNVSLTELKRHFSRIESKYEKNCLTCEYYNKCLFEHYTHKCCGHKQLIDKVKTII